MGVYVDDILTTGSNYAEIEHVKRHLDQKFGIKDLGQLRCFLGLEIIHTSQEDIVTLRDSQKNY